MSIHLPIIKNLITRPRHPFVTDDRRTYKGIEILVAALHLAGEIERKSESKTVGVMLPSSGAFPIAALAGWMLGRTVVPLNFLLKQSELQFVIDDCGCDTIVSAGPMLEYLGYEPRVRTIIKMEDLNFKSFPPLRWPSRTPDDELAVLLYTSGTSGLPKGVMLTHGNLKANVRQCTQHIAIGRDEVFFGVLPQFHSFGLTVLTLVPLMTGSRVVYAAKFVPQQIIAGFKKHKPTAFIAIPSMYNALLSAKNTKPEDFESLRYIVSGGEPLPDAVFEKFRERFNVTINEGYGLTETAPVTNWCRPGETRQHSVGPTLPEIEQRIVDPESGKTLPAESEGEIQMRGPNVMQGYYKRDEETKAVFTDDGFFRTGDIGKLDRDGFLFITGRLKEMLIVGGENVFPREIEEALVKHEAVKAAGVVGKTDPVRGELPVAFIELDDDAPADFNPETLKAFCREHIAGYKVPREIHVLDALPRNPTGKILRRELKTIVDGKKGEANPSNGHPKSVSTGDDDERYDVDRD